MTGTPSLGGSVPKNAGGDINRRIADLERTVRELAAARTLNRATIDAAAGNGIRTSDFDGTSTTDPGTIGNYFGGDGLVVGRAVFRSGVIPPSALSTALTVGGVWVTATNFALPGGSAFAPVASTTVSVPSGASSAVVNLTGRLFAANPTTSTGYALAQLVVTPSTGSPASGNADPTQTAASQAATSVAPFTTVLSTLPAGGTVTLALNAATSGAAWSASTGNVAEISGVVLWLR